ncbi:multidrug ABC transporter permease [Bacilli bacterium]|nr:multidrug ABC transporter permease [Bacilli bacterium]GHU44169.1 multidrug ABC transporter permease [Bacilli bacterium]
MRHLLIYRLKQTLRDHSILFWTLAFPMILGTFFFMAFGDLAKHDEMATEIPIAMVVRHQSAQTETQKAFLNEMQKEKLIRLKVYPTEKIAKAKLADGKISGLFYLGQDLSLTVTKSNLNTSILKAVLDGYTKNVALLSDMAQAHPDKLPVAIAAMSDLKPAVKAVAPNGKTTSSFLQYFFALIAYACLSGVFLGVNNSFETQANLSALGARRSISPTTKLALILVDFITITMVDFISVLLLTLYITKGFGMSLGDNLVGIVATVFMGCVIGVSIGIMLGASNHASMNLKTGFAVALTLVPSFFAGLMFQNMGIIVEKYCPIFNRINPAAVLADAFYCLGVYDNPARYARDMWTLAVMSVVCIAVAFSLLRRERYDSI